MNLVKILRLLRISFFLCLVLAGLFGPLLSITTGQAQSQRQRALVISVDGVINHVEEGFIRRVIEVAEEDGIALVIIELDTPGGLLSSTREIVEVLFASEVPTAVYVSPPGAQAGSAGTFITATGNFAVMAPGTNIGAATPVSATGEDLDETLANKATEDTAALMRSIAERRNRNASALENTVKEAASFTATEALALNIIDFVAEDLDDLLAQLDGKDGETPRGSFTLDTQAMVIDRVEKNLVEGFVEFIADPNISFLLLTIGGLGIVVELFNPGLIIPGVVGAIALVLAFWALGNLPTNWAGVAFIILALVLVVLETQVSGFGVLGGGAIVSFIFGGLVLFGQLGSFSPTIPTVSINPWLLWGLAAVLAGAAAYLIWVIHQSRRQRAATGVSRLLGLHGTVTMELSPRGVVNIEGETWTAVSQDDTVIPAGESITVTGVDGLILTVARRSSNESEINS